MKRAEKKIWFPAKRYGWGWGPPCCWQGWVVLLIYAVLVFCAGIMLAPRNLLFFYLALAFLTLFLVVICWLKGEKPRWRWGKKN